MSSIEPKWRICRAVAVTEAVEQTTMFLEPRRGLYGNQQSYIWLIELTPMSSKHFKQLKIETISQKKTNECKGSSFEIPSAFGILSFGKSCKCIKKC